ncbi:ABC transporter ATP-binding protein [Pseudopelagicola sp. nBUS_19]|uniref:ABC transporter ATP-binding protein n=1 Tax=Pseudopelagicola sp. nBUS_19 TaxID=3395316 RepID=UPI003EBC60B3
MLLEVRNLTKSFADSSGLVTVLRGVDLELDAGETLAMTGESGSGKSTLLHLIGGLDDADGGSIVLGGQEVTSLNDRSRAALRRETVGVVFQQYNLIPSLTVAANIAFQARLTGRYAPDRTRHLIDALGLEEQLDKYPEQLSGGQQQRVAIGRTLAARPRLVLADEPTGNLDETTASAVMNQMIALVQETGAALIMATHSLALAGQLQKRLHLTQGQLS